MCRVRYGFITEPFLDNGGMYAAKRDKIRDYCVIKMVLHFNMFLRLQYLGNFRIETIPNFVDK